MTSKQGVAYAFVTLMLIGCSNEMRKGSESGQVTIGGTIYEACTSLGVCEEVGLPKQEPPSSQTPTRVPPSLHDEMVKQTNEYVEIAAGL